VKVYPPLLERISGLVLRAESPSERALFSVGDIVTLTPNYAEFDDATGGPLRPGETGMVSNVDGRIRVSGWWYSPGALQHLRGDASEGEDDDAPDEVALLPADWFRPGDWVRTAKARARIESWDAVTMTLKFHASTDVSVLRSFKSGQSIELVPPEATAEEEGGTEHAPVSLRRPPLRIARVVEQPQAVQMRPYLRPKATTCAKTLYLPTDYDSASHMLEVFKGAFSDAKLGGMNEN